MNTCPIDNFLTIFYVLMKTRNKFFQYLLRSPELYAITLVKICEMLYDGNFAEGGCEWLKLFPGRFNLAQSVKLVLWGNEEDLFVSSFTLPWRHPLPAHVHLLIARLE